VIVRNREGTYAAGGGQFEGGVRRDVWLCVFYNDSFGTVCEGPEEGPTVDKVCGAARELGQGRAGIQGVFEGVLDFGRHLIVGQGCHCVERLGPLQFTEASLTVFDVIEV
jgi:hypothetical protein